MNPAIRDGFIYLCTSAVFDGPNHGRCYAAMGLKYASTMHQAATVVPVPGTGQGDPVEEVAPGASAVASLRR